MRKSVIFVEYLPGHYVNKFQIAYNDDIDVPRQNECNDVNVTQVNRFKIVLNKLFDQLAIEYSCLCDFDTD